ncbi:MAG: NAD(P)/FAD-dependent oxidoreductase [Phycisphaerae bacterium]
MSSNAPGKAQRSVGIIGAGLSGLCAARTMTESGYQVRLFEAADRPGGRMVTDVVDGFLLDRGFQVFLTSYPEAQARLDYRSLSLQEFYPGALIQIGRDRYRFADPWRKPLAGIRSLTAPVAGLGDLWLTARLRYGRECLTDGAVFKGMASDDGEQQTAQSFLQSFGFSDRMIDRFFKPFFGGVFLDRDLSVPHPFLCFLFRMFAIGTATVPEKGMGAIPSQLASELPDGTVRYGASVERIENGCIHLSDGSSYATDAVIVATDAHAAASFLPGVQAPASRATTTVYFAADQSPLREPILWLNANDGVVNHLAVMTDAAPSYSKDGRALVSVTLLGDHDEAVVDQVQKELSVYFGDPVKRWQLVSVYRIRHALPGGALSQPSEGSSQSRAHDGIFFAGDHTQSPSIQGAMVSGRETAEQVCAYLAAG